MSSSPISRDQVLHVAKLARLDLDEADIARMTGELGAILRYVEVLGEVDTTGVEPTAQVGVPSLPLRADERQPGLSRETALSEAPSAAHEGFAVPAFLDE